MGDFLLMWECPALLDVYEAHQTPGQKVFFYDMVAKHWDTVVPGYCKNVIKTGRFGYGYHVSYKPQDFKGSVVTLFRKPMNRIISAFLFHEGMMLPRGSPWKAAGRVVKEIINHTRVPIDTYARMPGVASCQSKMVLGKQCGEVYSLKSTDTEDAVNTINSPDHFAFIGLTEEPVATYQLFVAMYGDHYPHNHTNYSSAKEVFNKTKMESIYQNIYGHKYRKNGHNSNEVNIKLAMQLHASGWTDDADEKLYEAAAKQFYRRCAQYQISTQFKIR